MKSVTRTGKLQQLYELAGAQAGYFTAAQARELGYSARSVVHHVAARHFERLGRGFYRLVGVPAGPYEDVVAAWLRFGSRNAVVSHETALALYQLAPSRSRELHLTVSREDRPRSSTPKGLRLHTVTDPLRRREVTNRFGVRITSPARTIADVADIGVDPDVVFEATARALQTGLASAPELRGATARRSARVRELVVRAIGEARQRA
jgi:predicted transcriptional regulator of viral defense system